MSLKIRFGDFQTISRSSTLSEPTDTTTELRQAALALFKAWTFQPVRLIGVTAERLSAGQEQLSMFIDPRKQRQQKLDAIADRINHKFGTRTIRHADGQSGE